MQKYLEHRGEKLKQHRQQSAWQLHNTGNYHANRQIPTVDSIYRL